MNNNPLITKWVNDFRIAGPEALREKRKGRRPKVIKPKNDKTLQGISQTPGAQYLEQLKEENLRLRIENAYLKELRRLRLEETPLSKKRKSSTASGENLN